jgi:hypothetical protein
MLTVQSFRVHATRVHCDKTAVNADLLGCTAFKKFRCSAELKVETTSHALTVVIHCTVYTVHCTVYNICIDVFSNNSIQQVLCTLAVHPKQIG